MNKILSISIASYNVEKVLSETLNSLLCDNETLEKMEIIIVNDGSQDNTSVIASEYCSKYGESMILINKENGGYGSTINAALKVASGKYFRLLDGDDWYLTENLKEYIDFLETSEVDIVLSPYIEYQEDSRKEKIIDRHKLDDYKVYNFVDSELFELNDIKMHEAAVKTEILKKSNLQITENCFYTDTEYVFQITLFSNSITKYNKAIYKYRVGCEGQSISALGRLKHYKDAERVLDKILNLYLKNKNILPQLKREVLWNIVKVVALFQYITYLLFEKNRKNIIQVKQYDEKIYHIYKPLYKELGQESKIIRLLRLTRYRVYGMVQKHIIAKCI